MTLLPIPRHWPLDGGRYAGTADAVITRDPDVIMGASAAVLPRAGMRLAALRSSRPRRRPAANSPGGAATMPLAPPFDPAAPPVDPSAAHAPETTGTGARR